MGKNSQKQLYAQLMEWKSTLGRKRKKSTKPRNKRK